MGANGVGNRPLFRLARSAFGTSLPGPVSARHFSCLPEIAARERFDGLVIDQIAIGTEGVCEVLQIPLAVACNSLLMHLELCIPPTIIFPWPYGTSLRCKARNVAGYACQNASGWPLLREVLPYRFRHRLAPMGLKHVNDMPPSLVQVTQLPAFLDFPRRSIPDTLHYTGPWTEPQARADAPFPWDRLDGRPLIYVRHSGRCRIAWITFFRRSGRACQGLNAQLVLALGRKDVANAEITPDGTIVVGYAPQLALLKRAALVITHGGLNTTLEALAEGLPLVALPIQRPTRCRGPRSTPWRRRIIPVRQLTVPQLRQAVETVLGSTTYRESAQRYAREIRG